MRQLRKLVLISLVVTLFQLLSGCCDCNNAFISFDYRDLFIVNIDNSGQWSKPSDLDVMPSKGVAFQIQIIGEEIVKSGSSLQENTGYRQALAQDCACDDRFIPERFISSIQITSLEDINSEYCCGDNVSNLFLANTCVNCEDIGTFYLSLDELVRRFNEMDFYYTPINKFLIYLKVPVENDKAHFEIAIHFSDGSSIVKQTHLISIQS